MTGQEPEPAGPAEQDPSAKRAGLGATMLVAAALVMLVLAAVIGAVMWGGDDPDPVAGAEGLEPEVAPDHTAPLPDTTLEGFAGAPPVDPANYQGAPLILNFWATWCDPCREEMPHLQGFSETYGDQVTVLGVDVQDAPSNAEAFVEELGISYDLAVDHDGSYLAETQSVHMPTTLFVDPDGTIVYRHAGYMSYEELEGLAVEHLDVH